MRNLFQSVSFSKHRATSSGLRHLPGWFTFQHISTMVMGYRKVFAVILFGMLVHWLSVPCKERYTKWFASSSAWVKLLICVATVFMLYQVRTADNLPFIYFQF